MKGAGMQARAVRWDWFGLALGVLCLIGLIWVNRSFFHDDAYISLRYARHFAETGALEWNLGERVEGYTNFLFVIMEAGLIWLGLAPVFAAHVLTGSAAVLLMIAIMRAAREIAPQPGPAHGAILIAAGATPGLAIWVLGGLEAVAVAAFIGWGLIGALKACETGRYAPAFWGGLAFAGAVLTRLDSAVFVGTLGVVALVLMPGGFTARLRLAALLAGIPALFALAHMGWRLAYYGLPFPLTFYAKTGVPLSVRLEFLPYFPGYVLTNLPILLPAVLIAVLVAVRPFGTKAKLLAFPLMLQLVYVVWSGGDHMPGGRVLVPLIAPAGLLLLALPQRATTTSIVAAALSLSAIVLRPALNEDPAAFVGTIIGRYLAQHAEGKTISLATAGSTPFYADNNIFLDQLGLNDPVIARRENVPIRLLAQHVPGHAKGDGAYILSRHPDMIILGKAEGNPADRPMFLSDVEMIEAPEFARCYEQRQVEIPYDAETARRNPTYPNPLTFTWYERVCS